MRDSRGASPAVMCLKSWARDRPGVWPFSCRRWPRRHRVAKRWRLSTRSICSIRCRHRRAASTFSECCGFAARHRLASASFSRRVRHAAEEPRPRRSALNIVLQAGGGFGVVVLDLGRGRRAHDQAIAVYHWLRLYRVIEGSETRVRVDCREPLRERRRGDGADGGWTTARVIRRPTSGSDQYVRVPLLPAPVNSALREGKGKGNCLRSPLRPS